MGLFKIQCHRVHRVDTESTETVNRKISVRHPETEHSEGSKGISLFSTLLRLAEPRRSTEQS